jgi:tetratricopeptide (TPR) repeat protein
MSLLIKSASLIAATAFAVSAYAQLAPNPEATASVAAASADAAKFSAEDAVLQKHLVDGMALVKAGSSGVAINEHFDKVIVAFNYRYKDEKRKLYAGRGMVDKLMYMLETANSKEEPKRGALVVSSLWADAWYLRAYAFIEQQRMPEAKSSLESALELSPRNSQYLSELGSLYVKQRNWPLALKTFEQAESAAKEFSPQEVKDVELGRAWRGIGYVYIELNRFDEAEKMYQQCLALNKSDNIALSQLNFINGRRATQVAALARATLISPAQPTVLAGLSSETSNQPVSPALLDHLYSQLAQVENPPQTPNLIPMPFLLNDTQTQLRRLGFRAWPMAPRVAALLQRTEKNHHTFAWILMEMVPPQPLDAASVNATLAQFNAASGPAKLVELARLGKTNSVLVLPALQTAATDATVPVRLLASIGMAFAGKMDIQVAVETLAGKLSDADRVVRSNSANSLRLLGPSAEGAAPALINYLKTGENVYAATAALKRMSIKYLREARPEFEKILADRRLSDFQKTDATEIMVRLATE